MKARKKTSRRRYLVLALLMSCMFIIAGCSGDHVRTQKEELIDLSCPNCNVIFLNIELLRADYVDLISTEHGNNTPNIDKFFNNSIIFTDASAPAGSTIQSNIATLTDTDPYIIDQIIKQGYKQQEASPHAISLGNTSYHNNLLNRTIAERLSAEGYHTIDVNDGIHAGRYTSMDVGFNEYNEETESGTPEGMRLNAALVRTQEIIQKESTILYKSDNLQPLNRTNHTTNKFFLLLHSNLLHALPYAYPLNRSRIIAPELAYLKYDGLQYKLFLDYHPEQERPKDMQDSMFKEWALQHTCSYGQTCYTSESAYQRYHALAHQAYAQQVQYIDEELGKIFDEIESQGLMNNTIIVLYSNHGDGLLDNNVTNHDVSYQSCIHVPLLIRHPKVHRQLRVETPVAMRDLVPTITAMVQTKNTTTERSVDQGLLPAITNQTYTQEYLFGLSNGKYVRQGDMKLILFSRNNRELYNITADPHEEHNIAAQYPEIVKELSDALFAHDIAMQEILKKEFNINAIYPYTVYDEATFKNFYEWEYAAETRFQWTSGKHASIEIPAVYLGRTIDIHGGFFYCENNQTRAQARINGVPITAFPFNITLNTTTLDFESDDAMRPIDCAASTKSDDTRYLAVYIDSNTHIIN